MVDRFERFSLAISDISHYWHKIASDEMEKYGLKGTHAIYLIRMYPYTDGITAAKLSELCGKDKADVSRMISIMEKKGLVEKSGANHYRALLKLTAEGKTAAAHVRKRAQIAVEVAGQGVSDDHRTIFYNTLELIASHLQRISEEGLPDTSIKDTQKGGKL